MTFILMNIIKGDRPFSNDIFCSIDGAGLCMTGRSANRVPVPAAQMTSQFHMRCFSSLAVKVFHPRRCFIMNLIVTLLSFPQGLQPLAPVFAFSLSFLLAHFVVGLRGASLSSTIGCVCIYHLLLVYSLHFLVVLNKLIDNVFYKAFFLVPTRSTLSKVSCLFL